MITVKKIYNSYFPYFFFILLVTIAYSPTFTGGFILDDNPLIKKNSYIKEIHSLSSYFSQEDGIVDRAEVGDYHTGYYRPLINLTYSIDYKLWGMKAPGFRTTNLILHLLSCFILFKLVILLVGNRETAFWVTLIFALHPVNTESVSWIISRNNILATLLILSSFYSYIIWWEKKNHILGIVSIICFAGAILSKEFGLMVLPIFFLYHRFLSLEKRNMLLEFFSYVPFVFLLVFYFFLRKGVTGALLTPFDAAQLWRTIYFIPYLLIWNIKLVFLPYRLHYLYLSYPSSFFHWQAVLPIGLFFLFITILWIKRSNRIFIFSCLSFLVFIFPVLNIIPSASTSITLIAMRWLYLPMAFIIIGLAVTLRKALRLRWTLTTSFIIILMSYLSIYTYVLNRNLWHDENTFFKQEVLGFKNDFFAGDLAEKQYQRGEYQQAEKYFKIALEKYPFQAYHYINYSALLIETGRPQAAISYLDEAKSLHMTSHEMGEWYNNMGMALLRLGKKREALKAFQKSIIYTPNEVDIWANLGGIYGIVGDYDNSIIALKKGITISPEPIKLWTNLALTYIYMKNYEKAILTLEKIPAEKRKENKNVLRLLRLAHERMSIK